MKIKIWGTRGSIPSPLTAQAIREKLIAAVQGAKEVNHDDPMAVRAYVDGLPAFINSTVGGNTSCIELRVDNQIVIVDAGSGIRALGQELMAGTCGRGQGVIHLFLSHTHWDHIQGFPFFAPAFVRGNRINIYSVHDVAPTLAMQMKPATFPISLDFLAASIQFVRLTEGQKFSIGNIHVSNISLPHPGQNYAYRFEHGGGVCVYASDAEYKRLDEAHLQPYIRFFAGADVLIFDSQFTLRDALLKEDWGHSSPMIGADFARQAGVRRLVLFHHDPLNSDQDIHKMLEETVAYMAEQVADPTCEILIGSEGLEIDLAPNLPCSLRRLPDDKTIILRLVGDLDERVVTDLEQQLAEFASEVPAARPNLVVDMEGTTRLSIAGLRALIDLRRHWGGDALVLCGLSSHVRRVIELANYLDFFAIYPSLQAALTALEAREMLRLPGQLLKERYRIEAKVGESEKGIVLHATDTRLERPVAIKVLSSSYNQLATERFMVQAQQMARLNAPNVVALYDCDEEKGLVYLVMEYVDGKTLRQLMDEAEGGQGAALPILDIAIHILHALEYAHSRGVVHGNLRPENVLIADTVKLSDFGLRWIEQGRRLTEIPMLIHHPGYLAPEQIRGEPVESRTDLYAFGVMLYEFFTGRRPFEGDPAQVLDQHLHQPPLPPRQINPDLSRSLEFLIMKLLTKEPEQRYATATQVAQVLARLEHTPMAGQGEGSVELATPQRRVRLVGRDGQLRRLSKLWEMARVGQGQMVLIAGEAGVGKTRLAEELASHIEDGIVLVGTSSESEGNVPYQPFIEVGRAYLERTPLLDLRDKLGDSASVVATLVSELHDLMPSLPPLVPLNTEHERLRLMHGFTQFVARATTGEPWLLFLDDLHWADPASLQLLHYLARNLSSMRLLIVGTYRDVELELDHPLQELLRGLARYPAYQHMELNRLDRDGVSQLLQSMWRQEVPDEWISAIYQRTGGNPFYVEEVVKELMEEGIITLRDGRWHFAPLVELKLPQRVRDLVLRRVGRLTPVTQDVLRLAAVMGQSFSFADLLAVVDQPEERLLESLDELLERDMIREGEGGATLGFSHVEIHQVIYEELNLLRRRVLHRRVGNTLEQIYAERLDTIAGQLAHHFFQAGDQEKSFAYSLQMAKQARSLHAFQSALSWYTRAASVVPDDESYLARRVELYEG
ncbi:MAG: protein kinase, partial [Ardenticatenales bacterium]|nr:protein kinase [Ardenticatenales bacterium]